MRRLIAILAAYGLIAVAVTAWLTWTYLPRALGLCPYPADSRSYAQHGCGLFEAYTATTLAGGLTYYRIPMPSDAQGVRFYLEGGGFQGGDAMYLRFSASPGEVAAFLANLHAVKTDDDAEADLTAIENQDLGIVPWNFEDSGSFVVYQYEINDDSDTSGGVVTVESEPSGPVVYVYAEGYN